MIYHEESKKHYMKQLTERLVNELLLYKKYCDEANESMKQVFNSCYDIIELTYEEKQEVIDNAKDILRTVHKLKIVNEVPLIVENV